MHQKLQPYVPEAATRWAYAAPDKAPSHAHAPEAVPTFPRLQPRAVHLCAVEDILLTRHLLHRVAVAVGERKQRRQHRVDVCLAYA
jgi:hypothetical protein